METIGSSEKIGFDDPQLLERFFDLDRAGEERRLFWSRPILNKHSWLNIIRTETARRRNAELWEKRLDKWERHLCIFEKIDKLGAKQDGKPSDSQGAWRIKKLNEFLTILDGKIGMALAFNSLLLAGVALLLTFLPNLVGGLQCIGAKHFNFLCQVLGFLILVLLMVSLFVLLGGFRRVVWGDLDGGDQDETALETEDGLKKRESEYAGFLIIAVARRTNSFRMSTYITKVALGFLTVLILTGASFIFLKTRWCPESTNMHTGSDPSASAVGGISIENNSGFVQLGGITSPSLHNPAIEAPGALNDGRSKNGGIKSRESQNDLRKTHKQLQASTCGCTVTPTKQR